MKKIKKVLNLGKILTCSTCLSLVAINTFFSLSSPFVKADDMRPKVRDFKTKRVDSTYNLPQYSFKDLIEAPKYNDYKEVYQYNNVDSLDAYGWATIDGNNTFKQVFMNESVASFFASKCSKTSNDSFATNDINTISTALNGTLSLNGLYASDDYRDIAIQALNNPNLATIFNNLTKLDLSHNDLWFMPLIGLGQNYDLPSSDNITIDNTWGLKNVSYLDLSFNQMTLVPFYKNTNLSSLSSTLDGIDYSAYVGSNLVEQEIIINLNNNNIETGQINNNIGIGDLRFNKWNNQAPDNIKYYQFVTKDKPYESYCDESGLIWQSTTLWNNNLSLFDSYLKDLVANELNINVSDLANYDVNDVINPSSQTKRSIGEWMVIKLCDYYNNNFLSSSIVENQYIGSSRNNNINIDNQINSYNGSLDVSFKISKTHYIKFDDVTHNMKRVKTDNNAVFIGHSIEGFKRDYTIQAVAITLITIIVLLIALFIFYQLYLRKKINEKRQKRIEQIIKESENV